MTKKDIFASGSGWQVTRYHGGKRWYLEWIGPAHRQPQAIRIGKTTSALKWTGRKWVSVREAALFILDYPLDVTQELPGGAGLYLELARVKATR